MNKAIPLAFFIFILMIQSGQNVAAMGLLPDT